MYKAPRTFPGGKPLQEVLVLSLGTGERGPKPLTWLSRKGIFDWIGPLVSITMDKSSQAQHHTAHGVFSSVASGNYLRLQAVNLSKEEMRMDDGSGVGKLVDKNTCKPIVTVCA